MSVQTVTVHVPPGFRLVVSLEPVEPPAASQAVKPLTTPAPPADAPEPEPERKSRSRILVPDGGSKYARQVLDVDGEPVEVAGCVADLLRDIAAGARRVRTRPETVRKLQDVLPWVAAQLERDYSAKVISNRHVYNIPASLVHQVEGCSKTDAARIESEAWRA